MKTYIHLFTGVLLLGLAAGCQPMVAGDEPVDLNSDEAEAGLESIIRPGIDRKPPPRRHQQANPVQASAATQQRTGSEEFGLGAVTNERGEADLEVLSSALKAYVADRMVPAGSVRSLEVLVEEDFVADVPSPPPGMKYVWDRRLQVSLAAK